MIKGSCIECGVWSVLNGIGRCGRCEDDVRERRLGEEDNSYEEWMEKVDGMDVELVSVERIEW